MGKNGFIVVVFVFILVSNACSASIVFHLRKLNSNASTDSALSPSGSSTDQLNKGPKSSGKPEETNLKDSRKGNQNDDKTSPLNPMDATPKSTDGNHSSGKNNVDKGDGGNGKAANETTPKLGNNDNCQGSLSRCRDQEIRACVKASENGSRLVLVVQNGGKSDLSVDVHLPNDLEKPLLSFAVPKQNAMRKDMPSIEGKSSEIIVTSGKAKCELHLANPISVDNLIQQLSLYSKQVTPIYVVYGSFLLVLLFGGTWACCKLRKRNREDGVPYQELEMGIPESTTSGANVELAEGWDHDWDNDDWDEETAVKSPAGHGVRNISVDGLTSRSSKKEGWENDWED